jgi:hypothetical protein
MVPVNVFRRFRFLSGADFYLFLIRHNFDATLPETGFPWPGNTFALERFTTRCPKGFKSIE